MKHFLIKCIFMDFVVCHMIGFSILSARCQHVSYNYSTSSSNLRGYLESLLGDILNDQVKRVKM